MVYFDTDMREPLTIALIPGYRAADPLSQDFRENYIQDKNRVIPNDQELTEWMKKCINDRYDHKDGWFRIQFYRIFVNPKTQEYPIYRNGKKIYKTRYTVAVHYSVANCYWDEYDI